MSDSEDDQHCLGRRIENGYGLETSYVQIRREETLFKDTLLKHRHYIDEDNERQSLSPLLARKQKSGTPLSETERSFLAYYQARSLIGASDPAMTEYGRDYQSSR